MREYSLQDPEYRETVDLRNYKGIIENSVFAIAPTAVVTVYKDKYTITPDLPKGDLIKIGRLIAHTDLGQYCMIRPILFKGEVSREPIQPKNNEKIIQEQMNNKIPKKKGRCR